MHACRRISGEFLVSPIVVVVVIVSSATKEYAHACVIPPHVCIGDEVECANFYPHASKDTHTRTHTHKHTHTDRASRTNSIAIRRPENLTQTLRSFTRQRASARALTHYPAARAMYTTTISHESQRLHCGAHIGRLCDYRWGATAAEIATGCLVDSINTINCHRNFHGEGTSGWTDSSYLMAI